MAEEKRRPEAAEDPAAKAGGAAPEQPQQPDAQQPESPVVARLREELEQADARAEDNWNQFLRARAEVDNVRRRAERDVEQASRYAIEKFASEMLAVKDSLEMGLSAAQEGSTDPAKLREGTELTLKLLNQALERFRVSEIDPQGERFDPERHEAMAAQESAEHDPTTVIHVVQKGYLLGERLLRPAMVIVSRGGGGNDRGGQIDEQA